MAFGGHLAEFLSLLAFRFVVRTNGLLLLRGTRALVITNVLACAKIDTLSLETRLEFAANAGLLRFWW